MLEFQPQNEPPKQVKNYFWLKILIPLMLISAVGLAVLLIPSAAKQTDSEYKALQEKIAEGDFAKKYSELIALNGDFKGYLTLPNSQYGLPVVFPKENSEEYYYEHLFSGAANKYGTPFTKSQSDNLTVIKSKGFSDGRLLSSIASLSPSKKIIGYESLEGGDGKYAIFSAFSYEGEEPFFIDRLSFLNEKVFADYIENLKKHSKESSDLSVDTGDKLLILICEEKDETHILAARRLRENESEAKLQADFSDTAALPSEEEDNKKEENDSSYGSASFESSKGESSREPKKEVSSKESEDFDADKDIKPTFETNRFEQTGLTDSLDKTVKVEVNNVVTMVNVTGMTKAGAVNTVKNTLGLSVKLEEIESEEKRGTVIDQSVAEGAEVSTDVTVILTVSIGIQKGSTIMPDLIGGAEATAEIVLDKHNLRLGKVTSVKSSLEKGTILSQGYEEGSEISAGSRVDISVSDGSVSFKIVKMPNLSGKSKKSAKAAIKKAGLKVGSIKTVTSSKRAGTVVGQECPSGEKIEEGSTVGFSVSNGSKVNNLTVTNISSWSVEINGKSYPSGSTIKGDYMDIIPYIIEAEMGSGFNIEALKAQAVAAYCWLINAGSKSGAAPGVPMKNPSERAISAARAVSGMKLKYGSETAQTYYYAISAGSTANCKDVWEADIPYLRGVDSSVDKDANGYKTTVSYSAEKLRNMVLSTYGVDLSGVSKKNWFKVTYDENGAYARSVSLGGKKTVRGSSIRDSLCSYNLRSTAFKIEYNSSTDRFKFTVYGYGHGVGMSQVGANAYANKGWSYEQILTHYYPGTRLG